MVHMLDCAHSSREADRYTNVCYVRYNDVLMADLLSTLTTAEPAK